MLGILIIIIIILLILIVIWVICLLCKKLKSINSINSNNSNNPNNPNNLNNSNNRILGYANTNDPYKMPYILSNVLSQYQCQNIIDYSRKNLFDSETIGGKQQNVRNSQQFWISKTNPLVKSLFEDISNKFQIPFENAEDLQVVRYLPNQYYKEHHDSCCDDSKECYKFIEKGGQRILTVLIYLNNEFTDGETYFKNLNIKIKPPTGSAIVFFPMAENVNKCHPLALHAGLPVSSGEKWVANLWFHERAFA